MQDNSTPTIHAPEDIHTADYSLVSEIPGIRVTMEAASMLMTRYAFAASFCKAKDVLELGCGAGLGLKYLARDAHCVVGGDFTESLLRSVKHSDRLRTPLVRLDAQRLPFKDACFDVVLLFEAIYYLPNPRDFLRECRRVLRKNGIVLLCSANKEWTGFSPSALSRSYFSASEMREILAESQFESEIYGGFPVMPKDDWEKLVNLIRDYAVKLNLIPKTMRGKELLKRIFYGRLITLGAEIHEGMATCFVPEPIPRSERKVTGYKVIYAVARPRIAAVTAGSD